MGAKMNPALLLVGVLFPISEIALTVRKRARKSEAASHDRGPMPLLWLVISLSVVAAILCAGVKSARIPMAPWPYYAGIISLMTLGLFIRWSAIITLGRFFTTNVAIQKEHQLVEKGLYKYIRHPSYIGLLLEFLALGFYFANWLSIVVLLTPITAAIMIRIIREEKVLVQAFGDSYAEYSNRTKKLIPWLW
jgi:protein-S-isoprenylcysteine O-methyltransferase